MTLNDEAKTQNKQNFIFDLISKTTLYTVQHKIGLLNKDIIEEQDCPKKIKTYKNLIEQFEKVGGKEKLLDSLYAELILTTAAYQYGIFMKYFKDLRD